MQAPGAASATMDLAREALARVFGFPSFRRGQEDAIEAVLAGEDVLAVMPTGAGKSLLYQLPAVLRPGLVIVISPLIALMRDQVERLQRQGIAAAALSSANTDTENRTIEAGVAKRRYRLLYLAPERLVRPETIGLLREANVSMLAIDEAHCVSDWGHDFRPEYLDIAPTARAIGALQIIAVTATADPTTRAEIVERVFPAPPRLFVASFDRPNLRLAFARKTDPVHQIERMIFRHKGESGIVYCASRKATERLTAALGAAGIPALAYHAGLDADTRTRAHDEFLTNDGMVVVATIAFGMGIDKPDVRFVCHFDLPQSVEAYYHETGRAGRDGLRSDTLTLFCESDVFLRERKLAEEGVSPFGERERRKLEGMVALCEAPRCRREALLAAFGEASPGPCGNCDLCERRLPILNEAVVAARTVTLGLRRATSRRGLGRTAERARNFLAAAIARFEPTLRAGARNPAERSSGEWRSILYQLRRAGLIETDPDDEERWSLTEAGQASLAEPARSEATEVRSLRLPSGRSIAVRDALVEMGAAQEKSRPLPLHALEPVVTLVTPRAHLNVAELRRLAALKAWRLEQAKTRKIAVCGILHDEILIALARSKPSTEAELLRVPGLDRNNAERYGAGLLAVLGHHDAD
jgi:ATP-dependent DNA helicase RecQ